MKLLLDSIKSFPATSSYEGTMKNQKFLVVDICVDNAEKSSVCALGIGEFGVLGMTNYKYVEFSHCKEAKAKEKQFQTSHLDGKASLFENVEQDIFFHLQGNIVCFSSSESYQAFRNLYATYNFAPPIFQCINFHSVMESHSSVPEHNLSERDCRIKYQGRKTTHDVIKERIEKMGQFMIEGLEDNENYLETLVSEKDKQPIDSIC